MIQSNQNIQRDFLVNHIIDKLTEYLVMDYSIDIPSALRIIYESELFTQLQDDEIALYIQSPSYIYELLVKESTLGQR